MIGLSSSVWLWIAWFQIQRTFYDDAIDSCAGDEKDFFKIIYMHNYEEPKLESHNALDELVNKFADFFVTKFPKLENRW